MTVISDDIVSTSRPMCSIVCRPAWSCVLVDGNGMVDNVSGRALRCHSIFCAVTWGFWSCFSTQCSSWLTSLLRFYSTIGSSGRPFLIHPNNPVPSWMALMGLWVPSSQSNEKLCPCFLDESQCSFALLRPLSLSLSAPPSPSLPPLSPSPFLLLSLLCLSADCDALRAEITSACVLHSLPNTQASFSRLTKRELRLILA